MSARKGAVALSLHNTFFANEPLTMGTVLMVSYDSWSMICSEN